MARGEVYKRTWKYKGKKRTAYVFDILVEGKRTRQQFPTKAEAETELDKFKADRKQPKAATVSLTLKDAVARFIALKDRRRTVMEYERITEHLIEAFGADTDLSAIDSDRISAYKAQRLATKTGPKTERQLSAAAVNRPLAILRHLLRLARRWKVITEVPEFDLEREPQGRLRWLTPEEAGQLLAACRKSRNPVLADLVEFALFTGVRRGEALGLTWDHVDRARGVIRLEVTKSGHRREVPLGQNADAVLARRWTPGATGYVFGSKNWNSFRTAWESAASAAKLKDFRFHDLRHTFASWLVQRGRSLKETQEALGHRTIIMTMRYAHLAPDHLRAAVASLDGVLSPAEPPAESPLAQGWHKRSEPAEGVLRSS